MTKIGWTAVAGLAVIMGGGVALVLSGHDAQGGTLLAASVVIALALYGAKKAGK